MTKMINTAFNLFQKFSNRELAVTIWILISVSWMLFQPKIRKSLIQVIKAFFALKLVISDKSGKPSGTFNVKQVFINEDGLTYIYEVPTRRIGKKVLGVGQVSFVHTDGEQLINQMIGNWAVLGSELAGKAEFKRKIQ